MCGKKGGEILVEIQFGAWKKNDFIEDGKDEGNNSTAIGGTFMKPYDLWKGFCM